ncbi:MAG: cation:proton antiporter [Lentisphaeria bacterium]|nr:cation:proton antiporter [Lentisphaeria bacterium]
MALGLAELVILGLLVDWLVRKARLPGLVGLLLLGIMLGPHVGGLLNAQTRAVASDLRLIALVVILLRAGFEVSREALAKVGGHAVLMTFVPCLCEVGVVTLVGPSLLGLTRMEAAMLGGVLAAVSPAVVVPLMIRFIEEGRGADKAVPTLVLAGASCDDAVAIVICMSFVGMYVGDTVNVVWQVCSVPISVLTGVAIGLGLGVALYKLFDRFNPRATKRVLILLGVSVVLLHFQHQIEKMLPFAALISIMAIGFIILERREHAAHEISSKLGKIWVFAQLLLFTLVGAEVNVPVALRAGLGGAAVIVLGLLGRSIGVQLCLLKSNLNGKERLFAGLSYLPKATVQAAIGATPLLAMRAAGMPTGPGEVILAVAVLSILLTAPTGALLISWGGRNLLSVTSPPGESPAMQAARESE